MTSVHVTWQGGGNSTRRRHGGASKRSGFIAKSELTFCIYAFQLLFITIATERELELLIGAFEPRSLRQGA